MGSIPAVAKLLIDFEPQHAFFVGIDSDGCAFDAMELKHKECFTPNTSRVWGLQPISKYVRETADFVNLYSKWRGQNRWIALVKVFAVGVPPAQIERRRRTGWARDREDWSGPPGS